MSEIRLITPEELGRLSPETVLIDVREPAEFAGRRLPGSLNVPLSRLEAASSGLPKGKPIVVLCQSGPRSQDAAQRLKGFGFSDIRVLEGGLSRCESRKLEQGPRRIWAMERQVRMAAGSLVVVGSVLGWFIHPAFFLISAGVGAGLVYSAASDTCGMAMLLARMPWNCCQRSD